ncbi:hypothetical protein [Ureibacillus acetophenoni]|uniref:HTH cro/C1-type domain-containing protein n=1 Tax=Ureibacillus acetophenoni TaxID=614649 RepID=A0A285UAZ5_9BACL|nr:hypothetical protein [Ureibacillus acetophenoni]SOC39070.1 hypothetical protein SAMN05877842_10532 [Ureibacillus acetophenoni]
MKKRKANQEIRNMIKSMGYKQWEVAELLKIDESVFSRLLRKELEQEEKRWLILEISKLGDVCELQD